MGLVDALIRAEKDFDLLVVPGADHLVSRNAYVNRREWDFLVRNLQGVVPPDEFRLRFTP
jgi:hypothetical protein